jgi:multidrug efflux pump subunit AcrA (membrane-fusion protein)
MHLDTNIDESDISRVQLGQEASFTVDAFPGQTFRGEVIQVRRAAVNVQNVVSYTVVVSVDNSDLRLFPGMTANTRIIVDRVQDTLRIPSAALRFRAPDEIKVIGDVGGKGKGGGRGFNPKGDEVKSGDTKQTTENNEKSKTAPTQTVAQNDGGARRRPDNVNATPDGSAPSGENGGGFRRRNGGAGDGSDGGGRGDFDPSQFKGRDGKGFDPSQFKGRDGKGFDPSQFKGRNGNAKGNNAKGTTNARAGNQFAGFGRGGAGAATRPTFQTVYRLTGKEYEVEALRVRTGISDGNWVQLMPGSPLKEGDELVTAVDGLPVAANQNKGNQPGGFPGGGNNNFKGKGGFGF